MDGIKDSRITFKKHTQYPILFHCRLEWGNRVYAGEEVYPHRGAWQPTASTWAHTHSTACCLNSVAIGASSQAVCEAYLLILRDAGDQGY